MRVLNYLLGSYIAETFNSTLNYLQARQDISVDSTQGSRVWKLGDEKIRETRLFWEEIRKRMETEAEVEVTVSELHNIDNLCLPGRLILVIDGEFTNHASSSLECRGGLHIRARKVNNIGAKLLSNAEIVIEGEDLHNEGGTVRGKQALSLHTSMISNQHGLIESTEQDLYWNASEGGILANAKGTLRAQGNLLLNPSEISTDILSSGVHIINDEGVLESVKGLFKGSVSDLSNQQGYIYGNIINLHTGNFSNREGEFVGMNDVFWNADNGFDNYYGNILSLHGQVAVNGMADISSRFGNIHANKGVHIKGASFEGEMERTGSFQDFDNLYRRKGKIWTTNGIVSIETTGKQEHRGVVHAPEGIELFSLTDSVVGKEAALLSSEGEIQLVSRKQKGTGVLDLASFWGASQVTVDTGEASTTLFRTEIRSGLKVVSSRDVRISKVFQESKGKGTELTAKGQVKLVQSMLDGGLWVKAEKDLSLHRVALQALGKDVLLQVEKDHKVMVDSAQIRDANKIYLGDDTRDKIPEKNKSILLRNSYLSARKELSYATKDYEEHDVIAIVRDGVVDGSGDIIKSFSSKYESKGGQRYIADVVQMDKGVFHSQEGEILLGGKQSTQLSKMLLHAKEEIITEGEKQKFQDSDFQSLNSSVNHRALKTLREVDVHKRAPLGSITLEGLENAEVHSRRNDFSAGKEVSYLVTGPLSMTEGKVSSPSVHLKSLSSRIHIFATKFISEKALLSAEKGSLFVDRSEIFGSRQVSQIGKDSSLVATTVVTQESFDQEGERIHNKDCTVFAREHTQKADSFIENSMGKEFLEETLLQEAPQILKKGGEETAQIIEERGFVSRKLDFKTVARKVTTIFEGKVEELSSDFVVEEIEERARTIWGFRNTFQGSYTAVAEKLAQYAGLFQGLASTTTEQGTVLSQSSFEQGLKVEDESGETDLSNTHVKGSMDVSGAGLDLTNMQKDGGFTYLEGEFLDMDGAGGKHESLIAKARQRLRMWENHHSIINSLKLNSLGDASLIQSFFDLGGGFNVEAEKLLNARNSEFRSNEASRLQGGQSLYLQGMKHKGKGGFTALSTHGPVDVGDAHLEEDSRVALKGGTDLFGQGAKVSSKDEVEASAKGLVLVNDIKVKGSKVNYKAEEDVFHRDAESKASTGLTLNANGLDNTGGDLEGNGGQVSTKESVVNHQGRIAGAERIEAKYFQNEEGVLDSGNGQSTVRVESYASTQGSRLQGAGSLRLIVNGEGAHLRGEARLGESLEVGASSIENEMPAYANKILLEAPGELVNRAPIEAKTAILKGENFSQEEKGSVKADDAQLHTKAKITTSEIGNFTGKAHLGLYSQENVDVDAKLETPGRSTLQGKNVNFTAVFKSFGQGIIKALENVNFNQMEFLAGDGLEIEAKRVQNQASDITVLGDAKVSGEQMEQHSDESRNASFSVEGNLDLKLIRKLINDGSQMVVTGNARYSAEEMLNLDREHVIVVPICVGHHYRWHGSKKRRYPIYAYQEQRISDRKAVIATGGKVTLDLSGLFHNTGSFSGRDMDAKARELIVGTTDSKGRAAENEALSPTQEIGDKLDPENLPSVFYARNSDKSSPYEICSFVPEHVTDYDLTPFQLFEDMGVPTEEVRFLLDPFAEGREIQKKALSSSGRIAFVGDVGSSIEHRGTLYENTLQFSAQYPEAIMGTPLSEQLQEKLESPIIWYVKKQLGAREVLAPTVYLPKESIESLQHKSGGHMAAENDASIEAEKLQVTGFVDVGNDLIANADEMIIERRITHEREEAAKRKSAGKSDQKKTIRTDVVDEGGAISVANTATLSGNTLRATGGALKAGGSIQAAFVEAEISAIRRMSVHRFKRAKKAANKSVETASLRPELIGSEFVSGNALDLDIENKLNVSGSDLIGWKRVNVKAGSMKLASLFDSYKAESTRGAVQEKDVHMIVKRDGSLFCVDGDTTIRLRKGGGTFTGKVGSYHGTLRIDSKGDVYFKAQTKSVTNKSRSSKGDGIGVRDQITQNNTTDTTVASLFGGDVIIHSDGSVTGKGLKLQAQKDASIEAKEKVSLAAHEVKKYIKSEGFSFSVSFFGSRAIEALAEGKPLKEVATALIMEDPAISAVFKLAKSRHGPEIAMSALSGAVTVWNEVASLAAAKNLDNLSGGIGQQLGLTDAAGNFDPRLTFRLGHDSNNTRWTELFLTQLVAGHDITIKAFEQEYIGLQAEAENDISLTGLDGEKAEKINFQAAEKKEERETASQGMSLTVGGAAPDVGVDVSMSKSSRNSKVNTHLKAGATLAVKADEVTAAGVVGKARKLEMKAEKLTAQSLQDECRSKHKSASLGTSGNVSLGAGHSRSNITGEQTMFMADEESEIIVEQASLEGVAMKNVKFKKGAKVSEKDLKDTVKGSSFSASLNLLSVKELLKGSEHRDGQRKKYEEAQDAARYFKEKGLEKQWKATLLKMPPRPKALYDLGSVEWERERGSAEVRNVTAGIAHNEGMGSDWEKCRDEMKVRKSRGSIQAIWADIDQIRADVSEHSTALGRRKVETCERGQDDLRGRVDNAFEKLPLYTVIEEEALEELPQVDSEVLGSDQDSSCGEILLGADCLEKADLSDEDLKNMRYKKGIEEIKALEESLKTNTWYQNFFLAGPTIDRIESLYSEATEIREGSKEQIELLSFVYEVIKRSGEVSKSTIEAWAEMETMKIEDRRCMLDEYSEFGSDVIKRIGEVSKRIGEVSKSTIEAWAEMETMKIEDRRFMLDEYSKFGSQVHSDLEQVRYGVKESDPVKILGLPGTLLETSLGTELPIATKLFLPFGPNTKAEKAQAQKDRESSLRNRSIQDITREGTNAVAHMTLALILSRSMGMNSYSASACANGTLKGGAAMDSTLRAIQEGKADWTDVPKETVNGFAKGVVEDGVGQIASGLTKDPITSIVFGNAVKKVTENTLSNEETTLEEDSLAIGVNIATDLIMNN